tara:strand:+ start:3022 stop:4788 length:1767 start_codon:yes stop_codon:yes gene_type:complete
VSRDYFILNELLVPRLLYLAFTGKMPVVLYIWPLVGANRGWMKRLCAWLAGRGKTADPFSLRPEWDRFREKQGGVEAYGFYTDAYMKLEPSQEAFFGMRGLDERIPDYAQAARHRICTHYADVHWLVLAVRDLAPADRLFGLLPELKGFAETYTGEAVAFAAPGPLQFCRLLNMATWLLVTLFSVIWILRHIVLRPPVRKAYFLGADLLQVLRHLYVTREMVDDDSDCLIVFRNQQFQNMYRDKIGSIDNCLVTEGVVPLGQLLAMLWLVIRDQARIFVRLGGLSPSLYRRIVTLVHWRVVFRALFNRFDLKNFLARDDYNGEHVIRTQELRRSGARSLGIGHGLPTPNRISPVFRYLDFDCYFTFTKKFFDIHYSSSFTPMTEIVGIGSIGLPRDLLSHLGDPRPEDIIVYLSHDLEAERYVEAMQEIARRFPDRRLLCKIKESQFGHGTADFFINAIEAGPDNLVETREDSYALMLKGRYAISNDSTVISEAVGFGVCTFMYDVYDEVAPTDGHPSMFRDVPEMCVASADEFESRIRSLEDGSWQYPREKMDILIEMSGLNPFDLIRSRIGLAVKEPLEPMKIDAA